ncbi:hypothetical protein [Leucobacter japonicus]|uniref:hypothetical protein n=1 Tax=Leucobacter japonicus TaxID=1461259 RepID=UPI0006A75A74|nr:hypothetical protein [Leucobacter japonicus]
MSDRAQERVVRRELHASRSTPATIVVIVVALALCWAAAETVLQMLDRPPLWVSPSAAIATLRDAPASASPAAVVGSGVLCIAVGLALLILAISPARRARHRLTHDTVGIVADNGVIASSVAAEVARLLGLRPAAVHVGVGRRVVDVTVRPEPGLPLDPAEVSAAATGAITDVAAAQALQPRVRIAREREAEEIA